MCFVKRLEATLAIMVTTSAAVLKLRAWVDTLVWQRKLTVSPTGKMEKHEKKIKPLR